MDVSYFEELIQCYAYVIEKITIRFDVLRDMDARMTIGGLVVGLTIFNMLIRFIMRRNE